jgi:hypothetical protein
MRVEVIVEEPVVSAKRLNLQSNVRWSTGSTSLPGATSLTHCFCAPGTSGPSEGIYANKRRLPFSYCYQSSTSVNEKLPQDPARPAPEGSMVSVATIHAPIARRANFL